MAEESYPSFGVLLVDDEKAWLRSLSLSLERNVGINNIIQCDDSREVTTILGNCDIGLVLLDLTMPHIPGEKLLETITADFPDVTVLVISGMNQIETAVNCIKKGAYNYFVKTIEEERLIQFIRHAIQLQELKQHNREITNRLLSGNLESPDSFADIVTNNPKMHSIFQYVEAVAKTMQPVLITGESGSGKELIAQSIHKLSNRSGKLLCVNIAGLDDNIFSDTLFGHVKGAYTGAEAPRKGIIEEAEGGTLLLDEIGDLSMQSQVKLLRLLQEGEYFPLGSDKPKRSKTRIILATHKDLKQEQKDNKFRKDLYYRLCTHHIHIPALRERKDDIPVLLDHFLMKASEELGKKKPTYPRELLVLLSTYHFPGNIRELKSMVFNAVSLHQSKILSLKTFIGATQAEVSNEEANDLLLDDQNPFQQFETLPKLTHSNLLLIKEAMHRSEGNQSIAARMLGISQPALSKRLKQINKLELS